MSICEMSSQTEWRVSDFLFSSECIILISSLSKESCKHHLPKRLSALLRDTIPGNTLILLDFLIDLFALLLESP